MSFLFALPNWLPWWVPLVLLVPALLYALAFLFMPFSVMGLKGRLDMLEARLDEIQHEIRTLALRLPEAPAHVDYGEVYQPGPPEAPVRVISRPPIPPAAYEPDDSDPERPQPPARPARREPRLNWPR